MPAHIHCVLKDCMKLSVCCLFSSAKTERHKCFANCLRAELKCSKWWNIHWTCENALGGHGHRRQGGESKGEGAAGVSRECGGEEMGWGAHRHHRGQQLQRWHISLGSYGVILILPWTMNDHTSRVDVFFPWRKSSLLNCWCPLFQSVAITSPNKLPESAPITNEEAAAAHLGYSSTSSSVVCTL